jgi:hypothetical protein
MYSESNSPSAMSFESASITSVYGRMGYAAMTSTLASLTPCATA